MNCREWILKWFLENGNCTSDDIKEKAEENYFKQGFIDSFQFIMLLGAIEEEFGVEFDNDRFQDRSFSTMNGLIKALEEEVKK